MKLQERIEILGKLGDYLTNQLTNPGEDWIKIVQQAQSRNQWFTPENINCSASAIAQNFLKPELLKNWAAHYGVGDEKSPKKVGIVMAGNIPMVGFHDLLCVFISGHTAISKLSSKDDVLLKHLVELMKGWSPTIKDRILFTERLNDCDAYIATGSNNSARYFQYYFGKYPSIIRKNRTSVAVLSGEETETELLALADDIMLYFGLGCRNITQIHVPNGYDFIPLLEALKKFSYYFNHPKYKNNFDYQLTIYIMNNLFYMTNESIVLIENEAPFSPIGTLHYNYYNNETEVYEKFNNHPDIQTIVGKHALPFGTTQSPGLMNYADGIDVMEFLNAVNPKPAIHS
ncbi:MAG: acyl-CoA reductase [Bacteroidota bacterium]